MLGIKWKGRKGQILVQERHQQTCITELKHLFSQLLLKKKNKKKITMGTANFCKALDY